MIQIPRINSAKADALSILASSKGSELFKLVPIKHLTKLSIDVVTEVKWIEETLTWIEPILTFLKDQTIPSNRKEARKVRRRTTHFCCLTTSSANEATPCPSLGTWAARR
ncbi:Uncharacterized protein Adt_14376 [Abeliophyllum distichum]|uniref:Uncharacterized protein n=1 Tax=Abeliophyllum distichum TaxID=126358 RepID=A0ABD1TZG7_9LAMI